MREGRGGRESEQLSDSDRDIERSRERERQSNGERERNNPKPTVITQSSIKYFLADGSVFVALDVGGNVPIASGQCVGCVPLLHCAWKIGK